ncbi:hypothetical protein WJ972_19300 [Achromobacter insuavis]
MLVAVIVAATLVWRDPGGVPAPLAPGPRAESLPAPRSSAAGRLPRVAVLAHNANTELTDFVVPYAVLKRSGAAEVWALGLDPGRCGSFPHFGRCRTPTSPCSTRVIQAAPIM